MASHGPKACEKTNEDRNVIPKVPKTLGKFFENFEKKILGGAPNFTISDLSNVRVGFLSRSFRARRGRKGADSGLFTQLFAAFGNTFLSSFVFLQSFRVWRYVRSLYKLMSFLVPPQKSCLHVLTFLPEQLDS